MEDTMSERAGHPAHDIIVRARQTQCCDPIIDGVLGSLIEECENLRSRIEAMTADRDSLVSDLEAELAALRSAPPQATEASGGK
jgi:hypothetical protein